MKNFNKTILIQELKNPNFKKEVEKIIKKCGHKMCPMTLKF